MIVSPSEYYATCRGQTRYMREVRGPFIDGLAKGERKRLRKCEAEGLSVIADFPANDLRECWGIIHDNRAAKGRNYSLSLEDCLALNPYRFAVMPGKLAVGFCAWVRPDTFYTHAWADKPGQKQRSPIVLLASGIYGFCQSRGVRWMDIGTADEPGLIAFKERLGFTARILE